MRHSGKPGEDRWSETAEDCHSQVVAKRDPGYPCARWKEAGKGHR